MAFKIEYMEREELDKLGVTNYKTELVDRIHRVNNDLWEEFGESKTIYVDRERGIWLLHLGFKLAKDAERIDRYDGTPDKDIFLFNYKGKIVEILLSVTDDNKGHFMQRPYNAIYTFSYMMPTSLDGMDERGLKELICEALSTTTISPEHYKKVRRAIYTDVDTLKPTECKI